MKRSKENSQYWRNRRAKMFSKYEDSKSTKNRYKALVYLLKEQYPEIVSSCDLKRICSFLKDADYNNREIRLETHEVEKEEKEILSQAKQIELGYEPINKELETQLDRLL